MKPEGVLPKGRRPPIGVRPLERGLGSLISRQGAKYATPQRNSLWAAAWRTSRLCVEPTRRAFACLPASDPTTALAIWATRLRTSHFALRRWAFAVRPGERERWRTGCRSVFQNPNEVRRPAPGPENGRTGLAREGGNRIRAIWATRPRNSKPGTQYPFLPTTNLASDETIEVMPQMSQVIFDHEPQRHRMVCSNAARILQDAFG